MKILYLDCSNGISGDMLLKALMELSGIGNQVEKALKNEHLHTHEHHAHEHHGRSWNQVKELIDYSSFSEKAKETAKAIYANIATAEAEVHEATLETVHFHEVGRDQAIKNALGIGMALEAINPDKILTSTIYDGKGTIICSHGEIPVPVPAVKALMQRAPYRFETADVDTEMVTPSGLAALMGIGAEPSQIGAEPDSTKFDNQDADQFKSTIIAQTEIKGTRNTGRGGLKVYILDRRDV